MELQPPTQHERGALRQFEAIYEEWRQATDAWLAAEVQLWTQSLAGAAAPEVARLGADTARLRDCARAAYFKVMAALAGAMPDQGPD